jgi:hypothetical protein
MDPGTIALFLVMLLYGGVGAGAVALRRQWKRQQGLLENHADRIKRLKQEREVLRLANDIEDTRIEAARAGLSGRTDRKRLDWAVNRRALEQVLGQNPPTVDGNPIRTACSALHEVIEMKQADGEETETLEKVLKILEGEYL